MSQYTSRKVFCYTEDMKIYVIRHGQTEFNVKNITNGQSDDVLTPEGIEQAKNAAKTIPKTIKHIYASSLSRAKQTAEMLNAELHVPITLHDELREVNFGELQGKPYLDEYKEKHRMLTYDWRPSGENLEDVKSRVLTILEKIKAESSDEEALIVAHGGIIRLLHFLETNGGILDDIGNVSLHSFDLDRILK